MIDFIDWDKIMKDSFSDPIKEIINGVKENDVVYDVGGNVGSFSDLVLYRYPNINVVIFEPVKIYYDYLIHRFKQKQNVKIFNCALIDRNKFLYISKDQLNLGYNVISESDIDNELIMGKSLSRVVSKEKLPLPTVMKVDVEESEYLFIEGCKDLFKYHLPNKIVMEIGITPKNKLWDKEQEMIEYLFNLGYKKFKYYNKLSTYDAIFTL